MGKTALIACVVFLVQAHLGPSHARVSQSGTSSSFKIDHVLDIVYATDSVRDSLLQQVLGVWQTVLSAYSVSNLNIKFVQQAAGAISGHHVVQYRVSGNSLTEVILNDVTLDFAGQLASSGISGVAILNNAQAGFGGVVVGLNQLANFILDIGVLLAKTVNANDISQSIFGLWQTAFASNGFTNQQISTVSSALTSKGQNVIYRISGAGSSAIDVQSLLSTFSGTLQTASLAGVDLSPLLSQVLAGGAGNLNTFSIDNQVAQLTALNDGVLSDLLKKILGVWSGVLGKVGVVKNLDIKTISKTAQGNNVFNVVYKITGQSALPINVQDVTCQVLGQLGSGLISGVSTTVSSLVNGVTGGITGGLTGGLTGGGLAGGVLGNGCSGSSNGAGGAKSPFDLKLTSLLTYTDLSSRDSLLQQLLGLFKSTFASNLLSNPAISFVTSVAGQGGAQQVVYKITGQSGKSLNASSTTGVFNTAIANAHLPGIAVNLLSTVDNILSGVTGGGVGNILNGVTGSGGGVGGLTNLGGVTGGLGGVTGGLGGVTGGLGGVTGGLGGVTGGLSSDNSGAASGDASASASGDASGGLFSGGLLGR